MYVNNTSINEPWTCCISTALCSAICSEQSRTDYQLMVCYCTVFTVHICKILLFPLKKLYVVGWLCCIFLGKNVCETKHWLSKIFKPGHLQPRTIDSALCIYFKKENTFNHYIFLNQEAYGLSSCGRADIKNAFGDWYNALCKTLFWRVSFFMFAYPTRGS